MVMKKLLSISTILLSIFGVIMIYSSSYIWAEYKYDNPYKYVINQGIFMIVGFILMFVISKIDYKVYKERQDD